MKPLLWGTFMLWPWHSHKGPYDRMKPGVKNANETRAERVLHPLLKPGTLRSLRLLETLWGF